MGSLVWYSGRGCWMGISGCLVYALAYDSGLYGPCAGWVTPEGYSTLGNGGLVSKGRCAESGDVGERPSRLSADSGWATAGCTESVSIFILGVTMVFSDSCIDESPTRFRFAGGGGAELSAGRFLQDLCLAPGCLSGPRRLGAAS